MLSPAATLRVWRRTSERVCGWWSAGQCSVCRRDGLPVTWLGATRHGGRHTHLFACSSCADQAERLRERSRHTRPLPRYGTAHATPAPTPAATLEPVPEYTPEPWLYAVVSVLSCLTIACTGLMLWLAGS